MKEEFVTYEIALAMRELGFDEDCLATIDQTEYIHVNKTRQAPRGAMMYNTIKCPLYQQVFRWFRKKHNTIFSIDFMGMSSYSVTFQLDTQKWREKLSTAGPGGCYCEIVDLYSYEEAELACLQKLIELVKQSSCQCEACKDMTHKSDCAVHNGPCDCINQ